MKCKVCGSENLTPDPAGYYVHAVNDDGAPMMCLEWDLTVDGIYAHTRCSRPALGNEK